MKKLNSINTKADLDKKDLEENNCTLHIMPTAISDEDIQALFNGILKVVHKKFELDTRAEILNLNIAQDKLLKALKEKQAECNRLKNEILYLKSTIKN